MIKLSELTNKEIINITDGNAMGFIDDVEFNSETGRITNIITSQQRFFHRKDSPTLSWDAIKTIGRDMVLVEAEIDEHGTLF